jgi:hypothetical protein
MLAFERDRSKFLFKTNLLNELSRLPEPAVLPYHGEGELPPNKS